MRVDELIEELQYIREMHGNIECRLAIQPRWPFEHSISKIAAATLDSNSEEEVIAYIAEGNQLDYLPGAATDELCW
jgi:hypothetical protein